MPNMTNESVKQILTAPVVLLRPSNEEERRVFSKDGQGWFYTFGLQSGQSFVAHLDKNYDIFALRPFNNLVPQLEEVQWDRRNTFGVCSLFDTFCQTKPGTPAAEREFLTKILSPTREERDETHPWSARIYSYRYPEMLEKVSQLKRQLVENDKLKRELLKGQQRLQSLMIDNTSSTNKQTQYKLNERRQNG